MASVEERLQILKLIETGKISASEGADLLRALDREPGQRGPEPLTGASAPRWFRVRITDLTSGKSKVSVNMPLGLVSMGVKMGARFVPDMNDVDWEQLIERIREGAHGRVVDFIDHEENEHIEIFVE